MESIIKEELSLGDLDLKIQWCQGTQTQATHGCILQVGGGIFPGIKDEGLGSPLCMEEERSALQRKKVFSLTKIIHQRSNRKEGHSHRSGKF